MCTKPVTFFHRCLRWDTPKCEVPGPGLEMWLVFTEQIFFSVWGSPFNIGVESWGLLPCHSTSWGNVWVVNSEFWLFSSFGGGSFHILSYSYQEIIRLAYLGSRHSANIKWFRNVNRYYQARDSGMYTLSHHKAYLSCLGMCQGPASNTGQGSLGVCFSVLYTYALTTYWQGVVSKYRIHFIYVFKNSYKYLFRFIHASIKGRRVILWKKGVKTGGLRLL